ncbi:AraC family transcriptional regulator [Actinoplanes sp. NPDC051851]|uniref:helix-turn-helix domain-containing protein n=1 Tax=Actinoplanes sp. NPDC051851 TaxID=3154753 RepID=UPI003418A8ED
MLDSTPLLNETWARVSAVRCSGHTAPGHSRSGRTAPEEPVTAPAVVLVRRGVFVRTVDGRPAAADVTTGYVALPGQSQRITHPRGGDVCTSIRIPPEMADRFAHAGPLRVTTPADLLHRHLLTAHPADRATLTSDLLAALIPPGEARPPRPEIEEIRTLLHTVPASTLTELATHVGWSPWYLSRQFHHATGCTLSTYRRRLRVRAALDALTDPSADLATVATNAGFADQPHMTRAIHHETGQTPAAHRRQSTPASGVDHYLLRRK